MPAVAVLVDTDPVECRRQNRARDRPVRACAGGPVAADAGGRRGDPRRGMGPGDNRQASSARGLAHPRREDAASQQRQRPVRMGLVLQLSRFPWGEDAAGPARWLAAVAHAAAEAGLQGIALMDHLIQIPRLAPPGSRSRSNG